MLSIFYVFLWSFFFCFLFSVFCFVHFFIQCMFWSGFVLSTYLSSKVTLGGEILLLYGGSSRRLSGSSGGPPPEMYMFCVPFVHIHVYLLSINSLYIHL